MGKGIPNGEFYRLKHEETEIVGETDKNSRKPTETAKSAQMARLFGANPATLKRQKVCKTEKGQKAFQNMVQTMLTRDLSCETVAEVLSNEGIETLQLIEDESGYQDLSAGAVMMAKHIQLAMLGNVRSAEFVRECAGYKPADGNDGEGITDADKSLISKVSARLGLDLSKDN